MLHWQTTPKSYGLKQQKLFLPHVRYPMQVNVGVLLVTLTQSPMLVDSPSGCKSTIADEKKTLRDHDQAGKLLPRMDTRPFAHVSLAEEATGPWMMPNGERKYNLSICLEIKENQSICEKHLIVTPNVHWVLHVSVIIIIFFNFQKFYLVYLSVFLSS